MHQIHFPLALLRKTEQWPLPHVCTIFGWASWIGTCLPHTEVLNTQGGETCLKEVEKEKKNELSCLFIWYPEESNRKTMVTTEFLSSLSFCSRGCHLYFMILVPTRPSIASRPTTTITRLNLENKANSFLMILSLSRCSKWLYVQIILEEIILKACHCTLQTATRTPWCVSPLLKQLPKINTWNKEGALAGPQ